MPDQMNCPWCASWGNEHADWCPEASKEFGTCANCTALAAENARLREAILKFLKWENECVHTPEEWMAATEALAEAAKEKGD